MLLTKTADHWIRLDLRLPVFLKPKMWDQRGLEDVIGFPKFFDIHVFVKEKGYGGKVCGEGECKSQDYTAAQSYYLQPASLWPSKWNPHQSFAILANYLGDDLLTVYRYFWSLGTEVDANDNMLSLHSVTLLTGRQEVAFSEGAHVNSVENTQDAHETLKKITAAEGPFLWCRRPTAAARNRRRPSLFQTTGDNTYSNHIVATFQVLPLRVPQ
ncbi:SMG7-like protein [Tanacetum coccineum]|uniref:SMG7-like protein n=1 Tax=Tanacetum coccineum TaxID=301880 RepID=A0ABQ5H5W2_9ASTR